MSLFRSLLLPLLLTFIGLSAADAKTWRFVVSGDSRNCGDVVMPEIAKAAQKNKAAFYWHLGDYRAIYLVDEDYAKLHNVADPKNLEALTSYQQDAWTDYMQNQLESFGKTPVYLALGNHELIPPKTREEALLKFSKWFDAPSIRKQRKHDNPNDSSTRSYYHWVKNHIDFVTLDNASKDQFDAAQLSWIHALLQRDQTDKSVRAVVIGMHEALPESVARAHSMSDYPVGEESGKQVYAWLLDFKRVGSKPIYILASHSHFYMDGIFQTQYWLQNGGILRGLIIGTAGAVRYTLPDHWKDANDAKEHVYGYLVGTVTDDEQDPLHLDFKEIPESDVLPKVSKQFGPDFVHQCWVGNP